ncbi:glutathione S-transferase family protein [uncultured Parasphingorhabdus sp.]|uniref:glutathione S-transferase family protein n=1 Tax=uncultured Parasphingorhabdus sp. TaxID=2709694 RepID=UPI002AA746B8|nr:glutathione S-transferase family protein [uncultured Parasphingorhabdus sp.]
MNEIELYSFDTCPYSQRVQIVLFEKDIEYLKTNVNLRPADDWFKKISPYGEVPALNYKSSTIVGSTIINEFLEDCFQNVSLLPSDITRRAQARFWINTCDNRLMPACHALIRDRRDAEKQLSNLDQLDAELIHLSDYIEESGGPYWMGDQFSLVDATFAPFIERYVCYQELWGARWPEEASALKDWWVAVQQRESVKVFARDRDFHIDIYRGYEKAA